MLDHRAAVLDDLNARFGETCWAASSLRIPDCIQTAPGGAAMRSSTWAVTSFGSAKDDNEIQGAGYIRNPPIYLLSQDLTHFGIVDGDRDDLVPGPLQVLGDVEGGLAPTDPRS